MVVRFSWINRVCTTSGVLELGGLKAERKRKNMAVSYKSVRQSMTVREKCTKMQEKGAQKRCATYGCM